MTRTPFEAELAWSHEFELRDTYRSRDAFLRFCANAQADCERLGRTPLGSSAKVEEIKCSTAG